MSSKRILAVIIPLMIIGGMIACTHPSQGVTPRVSFSANIIPIFNASCGINGSCHLGSNGANDGVNLDSAVAYNTLFKKGLVSVSNPTSSLLYVEIKTGVMPLAPYPTLSVNEQNLILLWIEQGAKDN